MVIDEFEFSLTSDKDRVLLMFDQVAFDWFDHSLSLCNGSHESVDRGLG
jgi:hypothetical protein